MVYGTQKTTVTLGLIKTNIHITGGAPHCVVKPHEILIPTAAPGSTWNLESVRCTAKVSGKIAPKKPGDFFFRKEWQPGEINGRSSGS